MGDQSVDVVRGVYEAFGRGDVPAVLGAMADDIEWHEAESPSTRACSANSPPPRGHRWDARACGLE